MLYKKLSLILFPSVVIWYFKSECNRYYISKNKVVI